MRRALYRKSRDKEVCSNHAPHTFLESLRSPKLRILHASRPMTPGIFCSGREAAQPGPMASKMLTYSKRGSTPVLRTFLV